MYTSATNVMRTTCVYERQSSETKTLLLDSCRPLVHPVPRLPAVQETSVSSVVARTLRATHVRLEMLRNPVPTQLSTYSSGASIAASPDPSCAGSPAATATTGLILNVVPKNALRSRRY